MYSKLKNLVLVLTTASSIAFVSCSKTNAYTTNQQTDNLESAIKENIVADATDIRFDAISESKLNGVTIKAPTSKGSKKYYINGNKADAAATNAFITLSELSPVTDQSQQEEHDALSLIYKNTKQQIVHIRWDDGQTADFNINPLTSLTVSLPDGWQKIISEWKADRNAAIEGNPARRDPR